MSGAFRTGKPGRSVWFSKQSDLAAHLPDNDAGEAGGMVHCFALGKINEDTGNFRCFCSEIHTRDDIRLILVLSQQACFLV